VATSSAVTSSHVFFVSVKISCLLVHIRTLDLQNTKQIFNFYREDLLRFMKKQNVRLWRGLYRVGIGSEGDLLWQWTFSFCGIRQFIVRCIRCNHEHCSVVKLTPCLWRRPLLIWEQLVFSVLTRCEQCPYMGDKSVRSVKNWLLYFLFVLRAPWCFSVQNAMRLRNSLTPSDVRWKIFPYGKFSRKFSVS
jgi:hypothetical protein